MDFKSFKNNCRIVFMGTPSFAAVTLQHLIDEKYNIVSVVTMPDKPVGRGQHIQQSEVKKQALINHIPILQPISLKDPIFIQNLADLNMDILVVVAFRILPEIIWTMPRLCAFNLHASLLPQYRGAAPINWAIINGEKQTGVTTFILQKSIDTGNIILQQPVEIAENDNAQTLHDKLLTEGKKLTTQTLDIIMDVSLKNQPIPTMQQESLISNILHTAPKLNKDNCQINFNDSAIQITDFVRGLSPSPTAWCPLQIGNTTYEYTKIYKVQPIHISSYNGTTQTLKGHIIVPCKDGYIDILELQLPNKQRMNAIDFLNGIRNIK